MRIDIPEEIIDDIRLIDAINSGRSTEGEKDIGKFRGKFEELHRLTASVSDKVISIVLKTLI